MSDEDRKRVLILGCGYAGSMLAQALAFSGRPVVGTTRSETQASVIKSRGAEPILLDAEDLSPLDRLRGSIYAVVDCIPPTMHRDGSYDDPTARILEELASWELSAFVYVSATSVYGDHGGAVVTETSACEPDSPRGRARLEIEGQVIAATGVGGRVMRVAGIYGPGRSQLHRIAAGRYRLIGEGEAFSNRIHVLDLATLLEAAIVRGVAGATYLASDLRPATQREVVEHVVATYGMPAPTRLSMAEARVRLTRNVFAMITGSKRLDPSATLEALGVTLRWPDYASGLAELWRREAPALRELAAGRAGSEPTG